MSEPLYAKSLKVADPTVRTGRISEIGYPVELRDARDEPVYLGALLSLMDAGKGVDHDISGGVISRSAPSP
ncbi:MULTISPECIES: hypothetical protein [Streptomyces]|uniref:Uncharacterized protein n=2 Tax=Streptomyces TaxID=1883 RepID=A0ABV9IXZ5_9ACTN